MWVCTNSGRQWRTGNPGMLPSMGLQRGTQLSNWTTNTRISYKLEINLDISIAILSISITILGILWMVLYLTYCSPLGALLSDFSLLNMLFHASTEVVMHTSLQGFFKWASHFCRLISLIVYAFMAHWCLYSGDLLFHLPFFSLLFRLWLAAYFPGGSEVKNPLVMQDEGLILGSGRSPGRGNGNSRQCSCLENSMDRGAWQATVHTVTQSQTQLSYWAHTCSLLRGTSGHSMLSFSSLEGKAQAALHL